MEQPKQITLNCDVPELWTGHKDALRAFIHKRTRDHDVTNDLLQEILLKVYRFCSSKSGVKNVRSWLFTITQNTITDYHRKQNKVVYEVPDIWAEEDENPYGEAAGFILPMMAFLPEKYALPLRLSDIDNIKQQEIAEKLNLSLSATKSRIQRGRILLKNEFLTCFNLETDKNGNLVDYSLKPQCEPLQQLK